MKAFGKSKDNRDDLPQVTIGLVVTSEGIPVRCWVQPGNQTRKNSKKNIKAWLEQNKIYCRDDCLKPELVEILTKLAPEPIYAVDALAASFGHKVLRTPPYHPELQPIETCWGVVKNHVACVSVTSC